MRALVSLVAILSTLSPVWADERPPIDSYFYSGQLAQGEQRLELDLQAQPQDDTARFALGALQVVRGVERFGQSLYDHGCRSQVTGTPLIRIPLPENPDPAPISYQGFSRMLDLLRRDLEEAERNLSSIRSDDVTLSLRLADIRLDLDRDGTGETTLGALITQSSPQTRLPADNAALLVKFDRGDVAWLRAYCHLMMGIVEFHQALDNEWLFNEVWHKQFARPHVRKSTSQLDLQNNVYPRPRIQDPVRLARCRLHWRMVCELNHETWRYIRSERDDDHEWLPNPRQKGILGLPVSDEMIDAWLDMMAEFRDLLDGKKVLPQWIGQLISPEVPPAGGFNVRAFFDEPPEVIDLEKIRKTGINPRFLVKGGTEFTLDKLLRVGRIFNNPLGVGYAAWFN